MDAFREPRTDIEQRPDSFVPRVRELAQRALDLTQESIESLQDRTASMLMGRLAVSNMPDTIDAGQIMFMARGGNYKSVRANLIRSGKANSKQPMPTEQKKLRKRKRRKK